MNVGRYETLDRIGTGSMGTVYRARDTVLNRYVALKVMRCGSELEPELRERFYREAWTCAKLAHPGIVVVHDLGECDDSAYIAMELLFGADFRRIVDKRLAFPLETKIEAMAQVCDALAHAHRNGVLHRDIKPSNLFLTDGRIAKVLDFGMARLPGSNLTTAGRPLGTPNYMAPEQILGATTDERSDLFSAAVVLFELLVYAHPFQGDEIPRRIVHADPASLFTFDARLPAQLERILARALSKEPAQRFATADEFAAALRSVAAESASQSSRADGAATTPLPARKACRYCGASNRAAALYCIQCGGRLSAPPVPSAIAEPPVPPEPPPPISLPTPAQETTTVTLPHLPLDASAIVRRPGDGPAPAQAASKPAPPPEELAAILRNRVPHFAERKPPRRVRLVYVVLALAIGMLLLWTFWPKAPHP